MFKVNNINELETVYSILRERHPKNKIDITFNYNTKEYLLKISSDKFIEDPEVPVDLNIEVVYGDSVTGDTPIILRNPQNGQVTIKNIGSVGDMWNDYPEFKMFDQTIRLEKQYALLPLEVWSKGGWNPIKKVIRHKTSKRLYRVTTDFGTVDVTEDHSLCTELGEKIKPTDLKVGISLLHSFPNQFMENETTCLKLKREAQSLKLCIECNQEKDISLFYKNNREVDCLSKQCKECKYYSKSGRRLRNILKNIDISDYNLSAQEAECWGFFMASGSCGFYRCKSGSKNTWAINNKDIVRLEYLKTIFETIEPVKFEILNTTESCGTYKLVPKGSVKFMVDKYRPLFYNVISTEEDMKYKIVPECILNANVELKRAFWKGFCDSNKMECNMPKLSLRGKIGAQGMFYLLQSIGYHMRLELCDKQKVYSMSSMSSDDKCDTTVKKISIIGDTYDYVYDIETQNGKFGAGVGSLQCFNTDSVFLRFKFNRDDFNKNRVDTFKLATICGDKLTDDVFDRPPIVLEFEKVFQPFILLTKKRYIAKKYENMRDPFYLKGVDAKGIALTRRDYSPMVKKCYKEIIDTIMQTDVEGKDFVAESLEIFKRYINNIDQYAIDMDDLIISAQIGKEYACKGCKQKSEWMLRCTNKVSNKLCNTPNSTGNSHCVKCNCKFTCIHSFSLAHINLAQRMLARNDEVTVGDRLAYIFVETADPKAPKNELAEDPKYAKDHGLKANRMCYLDQVAKPILGLYKIVLKNRPEDLDRILEYTNEKLVKYGGKRLRASDFKEDEI